jgi:hypothetical protein
MRVASTPAWNAWPRWSADPWHREAIVRHAPAGSADEFLARSPSYLQQRTHRLPEPNPEEQPLTIFTAATTLEELRSSLSGRLATPSDLDYEELRAVFYGGDLRPAAVARVANADDIAAVIGFARATGTELAIRGGGHSGAGHSTTDGGIVIDMRDLRRIVVDPETRTAWADAGNTAAEVNEAVAKHGLVIGFGDTGTVGIGGITLGGGVGYLVRTFGMTIDNLEAVELVTAGGELVIADASHHPDLFWALRGPEADRRVRIRSLGHSNGKWRRFDGDRLRCRKGRSP